MSNSAAQSLGTSLRQLRGNQSMRAWKHSLGLDIALSTLSRYETGKRTPSAETLTKILTAADVTPDERGQLLALVRRGSGDLHTGTSGQQLAHLLGYERAATRITVAAPLIVPGILQTRDYARCLIGDQPDRERLLTIRMERANILTRATNPVELYAILHEEALTRPVATPEIMIGQRRHLVEIGQLPNITVSVVPANFDGWAPTLMGPFMVIEFADGPPVVHLEHCRASVFLWADSDVQYFQAAAVAARTLAATTQEGGDSWSGGGSQASVTAQKPAWRSATQ